MSNDYAVMKNACLLVACSFVWISCSVLSGKDIPPSKPLSPDDPKGTALPAGVPRVVDTSGNVISINQRFTTPQYQLAAAQWPFSLRLSRILRYRRLPRPSEELDSGYDHPRRAEDWKPDDRRTRSRHADSY